MPRLAALQAEWRANPPAHWLLAAALGLRAKAAAPARPATIAAMKAAFPGGAP
jgi:hypothetical protein